MSYKMYDEMLEQSLSLQNTLKAEKSHMVEIADSMKEFDNLYMVGCGSSLSTCYSARDAFHMVSDKTVDVSTGYEFYFNKKLDDYNSAVILTSQSGETADTVAAMKKAKENNIHTVAITNEPDSSMVKFADDAVITHCGHETAILGTKTYLTQLLSLYYLLFNMESTDEFKPVVKDLERLPSVIDYMVRSTESDNRELAKEYSDHEMFYAMGSGPNYGLAYKFAMTMLMEGALKHACPLYSGEFRHGLIERAEKNVPIVYLDADYPGDESTKKSLEFGEKLGVNNIHYKLEDYSNINELLSPFVLVVPLEWFTYYLAHYNEEDPGSTRHIGKVRY
ncbi:MAG: SIS domain-containing protein [Methanobacterium sp. ERen5]|nr:MAG: SIS domain-containing protein [Methanobacterium sp. ERen5]